MNLNETCGGSRRRACFAACLVVLCVLFFCSYQFIRYFHFGYDYDVVGYIEQLCTGHISGWWPPLSLYEMHLIFNLFNELIPCGSLSGLFGGGDPDELLQDEHMKDLGKLTFAMCLSFQIILLAVSTGYLVYRLVLRNKRNVWGAVFLALFSFLLPYQGFVSGRSDFFFVAQTFAAIALVFCMDGLPLCGKWVVSCMYFILLLHIVDVRHNAMLTMPLFMIAWLCQAFRGVRFRKALALSGFGCLFIFVGKKMVDGLVINENCVNPSHVMLQSDLRMAAILRGEYHEYLTSDQRAVPADSWLEICIHPEKEEELGAPNFFQKRHKALVSFCKSEVGAVTDCETAFSAILDEYFRAIDEHPRSMLAARLMTVDQFFCGDIVAGWKRALISDLFPAIPEDSDRWLNPGDKKIVGTRMDFVRCVILGIEFLSLVILLACLLRLLRRKELLDDSAFRSALLASSVGVTYLLSFLVVVTPTSDFRYHYPSLVLFCYSSPLLIMALFRGKLHDA